MNTHSKSIQYNSKTLKTSKCKYVENQGNDKKTQQSKCLKLWEYHTSLLFNFYDSIFKFAVDLQTISHYFILSAVFSTSIFNYTLI